MADVEQGQLTALLPCAGLGMADVEHGQMRSSKCVYRIASISKCITAAICMALHERGILDIDAPITKYLKDWPEKLVDGEQVRTGRGNWSIENRYGLAGETGQWRTVMDWPGKLVNGEQVWTGQGNWSMENWYGLAGETGQWRTGTAGRRNWSMENRYRLAEETGQWRTDMDRLDYCVQNINMEAH